MKYKWLPRPEKSICIDYKNMGADFPKAVESVLLRRGFNSKFLDSNFSDLSAWDDIPGASLASDILAEAIRNNLLILVHGDFDADGITATVLAVRVIRALGGRVEYHIPDRLKDGYGLTKVGVDKCIAMKASVLLTVDCGITSREEVAFLEKNNTKVIITDHHLPADFLPDASVIVDPELTNAKEFSWRHLAGVGVIYFVLRGLCIKLGKPNLPELSVDLVAIGTICDLVSLTGDNRILAIEGLKKLRNSPSVGIKALLRKAKIESTKITARDVGFGIGPRINSAGRVANAKLSVKLLLEEDPRFAEEYSSKLELANQERRKLDTVVYSEAEKLLKETNSFFAVAASANWHSGVLGISASKLSRELGKPVLLISWNGNIGKGSARGIVGMPVYSILSEAMEKGLLVKFGGHSQAAGLTIKKESFSDFMDFVETAAEKQYKDTPEPILFIDGRLTVQDCNIAVLKSLEKLEPFGMDNPEPVWIARNIYPTSFRTVGADGKHLQISFQEKGLTLRGIAFGMGHRTSELNRMLDVAFTLSEDTFRGKNSVQMIILDIKAAARKLS